MFLHIPDCPKNHRCNSCSNLCMLPTCNCSTMHHNSLLEVCSHPSTCQAWHIPEEVPNTNKSSFHNRTEIRTDSMRRENRSNSILLCFHTWHPRSLTCMFHPLRTSVLRLRCQNPAPFGIVHMPRRTWHRASHGIHRHGNCNCNFLHPTFHHFHILNYTHNHSPRSHRSTTQGQDFDNRGIPQPSQASLLLLSCPSGSTPLISL